MAREHDDDVGRQLRKRAQQQLLVLVRPLGRHAEHHPGVRRAAAARAPPSRGAGATRRAPSAVWHDREIGSRQAEHAAISSRSGRSDRDQHVGVSGGPARRSAGSPKQLTRPNARVVKKFTSCIVSTCGRRGRTGPVLASECSTSAPLAGQMRHCELLAAKPAQPLALLRSQPHKAREGCASHPLASARRAAARREHDQLRRGSGSAASAGHQRAQVGLRPARHAGVEEERVEAPPRRGFIGPS